MSNTPATRCPWPIDDLYRTYHDTEWGVPIHDDKKLFEFLVLEGAQAGLSWHIILKKRENYRRAFDNFHAGEPLCVDRIIFANAITQAPVLDETAEKECIVSLLNVVFRIHVGAAIHQRGIVAFEPGLVCNYQIIRQIFGKNLDIERDVLDGGV